MNGDRVKDKYYFAGEKLVLEMEASSRYYLTNGDIKSIITHEQFNSIKYVLGGKEE